VILQSVLTQYYKYAIEATVITARYWSFAFSNNLCCYTFACIKEI